MSGLSYLQAVIAGPGALVIAGTATINGLYDTGTLAVTGTVVETYGVQYGLSGSDTTGVTIAAGGVYELTTDSGISAVGTATIVNHGLLEKVGGTLFSSNIQVAVVNSGTVLAAAGLLDLSAAVSGTGVLNIAGGAGLELTGAVAAGSTVDFLAAGSLLIGSGPFAGTIAGFGTADTIDLISIGYNGAGTATLNAATDGLTVVEAGITTTLQLAGNYTGDNFVVSQGTGAFSGPIVTVSAPPVGEKIWVGGTSGSYLTAADWSPSGVPTAANDVLIGTMGADVVVPASQTGALAINSLSLIGGATLAIDGGQFAIAGTATTANPTGTSFNAGIIAVAGAALTISGTLGQSGAIAVTGTNGTVNLSAADIVGGTLAATGGGQIVTNAQRSTAASRSRSRSPGPTRSPSRTRRTCRCSARSTCSAPCSRTIPASTAIPPGSLSRRPP